MDWRNLVLTILDRYLFKETLLTFIAVISVLMLIIISQLFVRLLNKVIEGVISADTILPLLGLVVIKTLVQLLPAALLIAVMLTMGRLYQDSEIAAFRACGVSFLQICRPLVLLATPMVIGLLGLVLYILPLTVRVADEMQIQAKHNTNISGVLTGQFIDSGRDGWVVFVESSDSARERLNKIFIHGVENGRTIIETADHARHIIDPQTGRRLIKLQQGYRFEHAPVNGEYQLVSFKSHTLQIPELKHTGYINGRDTRPTSELFASDKPADKAELQRRISIPISAFILALMALPLSYTTPRRGRFAKLALGIIVYIFYANLVNVSIGLMENRTLPVWLGVWWAHLLMAFLTVMLFVWHSGGIWRLHWLRSWKIQHENP
jgi:lipopolysaccharide export system permease protein